MLQVHSGSLLCLCSGRRRWRERKGLLAGASGEAFPQYLKTLCVGVRYIRRTVDQSDEATEVHSLGNVEFYLSLPSVMPPPRRFRHCAVYGLCSMTGMCWQTINMTLSTGVLLALFFIFYSLQFCYHCPSTSAINCWCCQVKCSCKVVMQCVKKI